MSKQVKSKEKVANHGKELQKSSVLLKEVRRLIESSRQKVAVTVNAEMTMLYWHIGSRINTEILNGQRAEYGKQIIASLSKKLTEEYGRGWSQKQLRHCLRIAETFDDYQIVSAMSTELSWTHIKTLI